MKRRRGQAGLTFIELVTSIVIISVATVGLMFAVSAAVGRSANPVIRTQAISIGASYLEEASLATFCDPGFDPDGNAATGCRQECVVRACAGGCGGAAFSAETGRSWFDDVCDYDGLSDNGARDRLGVALPELDRYAVSVAVSDAADVTLGTPALAAAGGRVVRITVRVTHPDLDAPVVLSTYKANLE